MLPVSFSGSGPECRAEDDHVTLIWTRVDQKLIHGQVSLGWVPYLSVNAMVVADADTSADAWTQKIMMLGLPPEIELISFTPPELLAEMLSDDRFRNRRVMVIFKDLEGALAALASGSRIDLLNLGNQICRRPGQDIRLGEAFFVCRCELDGLAEFQRGGLEVVIQSVPTGRAIRWQPQG